MVPAHGDQLHGTAERGQHFLDPLAFGAAWPRCVDKIAEKHDPFRAAFLAKAQQFFARALVRKRPEFTAAPLRPTVAQVNVGNHSSFGFVNPERAGSVRVEPVKKRSGAAQIELSQCLHPGPEASLKIVQRIAIDMDEVMADTMGHCLNLYNSDFGMQLTPEHFRGRHLFEVIDIEHRQRVLEYFSSEEFFAEIGLMEGSQEVIRSLAEKYEVFVASAAMDVPCSFTAKFEWLNRHFPFIPSSHIVFCGDKSILAADYLIDDNIRHLTRFRGEGIIFTAPHNVMETRFRRVASWEDVRQMFLSDADAGA